MTKPKKDFTCVLYCDGGCNNHTHAGGYGSFAAIQQGSLVYQQARREYPEVETNQEAEYQALLDALQWLEGRYDRTVWYRIWTDSRLLVNQTSDYWRCFAPNLIPYLVQAQTLLRTMPTVKLAWIPRAEIVKVLGH